MALPVIIDSARYLYNTKTYRTQALLNESMVIFEDYKVKHKEILDKYPDDTQKDQRVEELRALSNDYMNACLEITKRIDDINKEVNTETGFIGDVIGDVYIEGKLNNHDVSEYVLRSELEDYGHVDMSEYLKKKELKDEVYKQIPEISFYLNEMSCMIAGMEEKLNNKLDKEAFGYNDKETLVNGIMYYNHQCASLEEPSDKIAIKLLPLVEDNQYYYIDGWLYVKNYWNSEVVYRIQAHVLNKEVEIHKISIGEKEYGAVIIEATDSYNWEAFFTGYYHDAIVCGIEKEFTDEETLAVIDEHALAKRIDEELEKKANVEHSHLLKDITDLNLDEKANIEHTHTIADITDLNLDEKADIEHTHLLKDITDLNLDEKADKVHEHTTADITDRISEYHKESVPPTYEVILQYNSNFHEEDEIIASWTNNFTMTFECDGMTKTISEEDLDKQYYDIGCISIGVEENRCVVRVNQQVNEDKTISVKDIIIDSEHKPNEIIKIQYIPLKPSTDMTSQCVITANALTDYCEENIAPKVHTHTMADITDFKIDVSNLATKEELAEKANIEHKHRITEINVFSGDIIDDYNETNSIGDFDMDIFDYENGVFKLKEVPSSEWSIKFYTKFITNEYQNNEASDYVEISSTKEYTMTNETVGYSIVGGLGCPEGLKVTFPKAPCYGHLNIMEFNGFSKTIDELRVKVPYMRIGSVLDDRFINGNGVKGFIGNKVGMLIDEKADKVHTHTMADITDWEAPDIDTSNLATKEELAEKANIEHTHDEFALKSYYTDGASGTAYYIFAPTSLSNYDYKVVLYMNYGADPVYQFNIYNTGSYTYVTMYVRRFDPTDDMYRTHTMLNNFVLYSVTYEGESYYALKLQNQERYELRILGANIAMEPLLLTEGVEEFRGMQSQMMYAFTPVYE